MRKLWENLRWQITELWLQIRPDNPCHHCGHDTLLHGPRINPGCDVRRCPCPLDWKGGYIHFERMSDEIEREVKTQFGIDWKDHQ